MEPIGNGVRRVAARATHTVYNVYIWTTVGSVALTFFATDFGVRDLWIARIIAISTGVLLALLLIFLVAFAVNFSRKARYAEILPNLHEMHHALRDLQTQIKVFQAGGRVNDQNVRQTYRKYVEDGFQRVLTQVVMAFGVTSGVNCRASIKLVGRVDERVTDRLDNLYVRTLARDAASAHACVEKDRDDHKKEHLITENTDFELLAKGTLRYFFSPNVNRQELYRNSSVKYWAQNRPLAAHIQKNVPWLMTVSNIGSVYPYTSVMTFPVKGHPQHGADNRVIGFLCIDTIARNGFIERYDANLGASVADALYHPLCEFGLLMVNVDKN